MKINKFGEHSALPLEIGTPVFVKGHHTKTGMRPFQYKLVYYIDEILDNGLYNVKTSNNIGGIINVDLPSIRIATKKEELDSLKAELKHDEERLKTEPKYGTMSFLRTQTENNINILKELIKNKE